MPIKPGLIDLILTEIHVLILVDSLIDVLVQLVPHVGDHSLILFLHFLSRRLALFQLLLQLFHLIRPHLQVIGQILKFVIIFVHQLLNPVLPILTDLLELKLMPLDLPLDLLDLRLVRMALNPLLLQRTL